MLLENLPHKCKIIRYKHTKDKVGGTKKEPVTLKSGLECWEQSGGSSKTSDNQKAGLSNTIKVFFVEKPNISTRHKIVITERYGEAVPEADRIELEVIGSPQPDVSAGMGILYRVMCKHSTQED